MFISLEGIDGCGKTTQARMLAEALGDEALLLREPGGTPAGERVRELLKDPATELSATAELLLFLAARAELCDSVIRPALTAGRTVICDRFSDSSVAYQGGARELGAGRVRELCDVATGGLWPDLTILIDVDPDLAASRRSGRSGDRFEGEGAEFQRRVAAAYAEIAAAEPDRVTVLDGARRPSDLHTLVIDICRSGPRNRSQTVGGRG